MLKSVKTRPAALKILTTREEVATLIGQPSAFIASVVENPREHYSEFQVPKSNGEFRTIRPPQKNLRLVQRHLLSEFYQRVRLPSYLHGGLPNRSIITHAQGHLGRHMVASLDVRKFFPSTTTSHVYPVLELLGFRDQALQDVLALAVLENSLPQGAPTSSLLANLAFSPADERFIRLCRRRELHYTRYVDDIAISGDSDFYELRGPFIEFIKHVGYAVADDKIHFMRASERQVVTGLVVNEKLRPTLQFVRDLKRIIRLCQEHGGRVVAAMEGISVKRLRSRLTGQALHVSRVDRKLGRRLYGRLCSVKWFN